MTAEATTITLPARLDSAAAEALHGELLEQIGVCDHLVVDGSEVGLIDTPAVQVLLAAERSLKEANGAFSMRAPSLAVRDAMQLLGLAEKFELWSKTDA
jgi:chemotaxis protein CheX